MFLLMLAASVLGLGAVLAVVPLLLEGSARFGIGRVRDLHHANRAPVPRMGGLALAAAFIAVEALAAFLSPKLTLLGGDREAVIFSSLAIFAIGFLDDLRPLGAKKKFAGQILVASLVWFSGIGVTTFKIPFTETVLQFGLWGWFFTVLWLVGMTNLINLIDGVDGLAGGICLMLMGLTAYLSFGTGTCEIIAAGMAGALLGFLRFNFPPARIYLGDGGAYFLGFQIGLYSIINSQKGTIVAALIAPLFVLTLPIVDTALAILRRGLRGLPVFRPDRRHIHHRLLNMGLSRRRVVLSIYGITMVFLILGLLAFWSQGKLIPVLGGVAILIILACAGNLSFSREWFAVGRVVGNSLEMRREIHYGLSLTRWLALEGSRCKSVEELWEDLVFVAKKLGFRSLKLTLPDGTRTWGNNAGENEGGGIPYQVQTGIAGQLDLCAPGQSGNGSDAAPGTDVFEILGELLAEGWLKAVQEWLVSKTTPLTFSAKPVSPEYRRAAARRWIVGTSWLKAGVGKE